MSAFRFLQAAFVFCLLTACSLAQGTPPTFERPSDVTWEFVVRGDANVTPRSTVYLHINGRRVLVQRNVTARFAILSRADYAGHNVPTDALTACAGWWAGAGEDFYVARRGTRLIIYVRKFDEQISIPAYRRLKSISAL